MIEIDYNPATKRFLIKAHTAMVPVVRTLPNKRWDGKRSLWLAPALATNIRVLKGIHEKFSKVITMTPEAALVLTRETPPETPKDPFPLNYKFMTEPFRHQKDALDKIWGGKAGALFMEPGTGKSKVAIDWFSALHVNGLIDAVVVLCPVSIKMNWENQVQTHCPIFTHVALQGSKTRPQELAALPVFVCGIESMSVGDRGSAYKEMAAFMSGRNVAIVVDESHLIKTHDSTRTKLVHTLGKKAKYKLCLTGTPVTQGVMDLYSQFEFLDTDILGIGDFYSFRNRYAVMGGYENKQIIGYQNVEELTELIKPFIYQCRSHEVLDLPPKTYQKRFVSLSAEQSKVYKQMKRDRLAFLNNAGVPLEVAVENILTAYQHMQTVTSGFMYVVDENNVRNTVRIGGSAKVNELCNVLDDLPNDLQVIIWCRFKEEVLQVSEAIKVYGGVSLRTGDMDEKEKDEHLQAFKKGVNRFFVSSQSAGGVGLTLNEAKVAIYISNTFSTTDRIQSEARCWRIGQASNVLYIDIVAKDTVDEHILKALEGKMDLAEYIKNQIANKEKL